jgi:hypothetical protein
VHCHLAKVNVNSAVAGTWAVDSEPLRIELMMPS